MEIVGSNRACEGNNSEGRGSLTVPTRIQPRPLDIKRRRRTSFGAGRMRDVTSYHPLQSPHIFCSVRQHAPQQSRSFVPSPHYQLPSVQIFAMLLENAGSLVTKQRVLDSFWPGTFVGDAVPKDNIRQLRNCRITGRRRLLPMLMVQNTEQSAV